jgi:outer membrane protein OmpA-like peptidoglycan-associated protein
MQSKKYFLLFAMFLLVAGGTYAQNATSGYDVFDSSLISRKNLPQQTEFWNNTYNFPAKPRNQWEVGVSGGMFSLSSDVPALLPTFGFSAHVRKSLGYIFSVRLQYLNGTAKGLNWNASRNFGNNSSLNNVYSAPINTAGTATSIAGRAPEVVYYNYKNRSQDLSLQGIVTLNNIRFHKNKTSFVFYGGAGVGFTAYETKINARNESTGDNYSTLYTDLFNNTDYLYKNRNDIRKSLRDNMDDTYETAAQQNGVNGQRRLKIGNQTVRFSTTVLAGVAIKLSNRINLAIEDRHTFVKDDLLDGQQWQEHPLGDAVLTSNWDSYNYLSLGLNFNLGTKSVEPLWWLNPLDYAYGELNTPRHTKFPKQSYDDSDGDGVIDQLDREPNTPAGAAVDTHGVARDTDGDGIPDYKDKQLVTPSECQPVDADGVGKCPEPECCKRRGGGGSNDDDYVPSGNCPTEFPSVPFNANSVALTADAKGLLTSVIAQLKENPDCSITLIGYSKTSKASQALSQQRLKAIQSYLVNNKITSNRVNTLNKINGGDENTVDVRGN